jgi:hypothetical protein
MDYTLAEYKSPEYEVKRQSSIDSMTTRTSGTDVMIFKIFSPKNSAKKLAFLTQNKGKLSKILIITLDFEKNAIFCRKLSKIAENCDHNIDT